MTKLYIDTCIIIDAVEGRKNEFGKSIGNPASDLFFQATNCKYHIIISDLVLEELAGLKKLELTKMFFKITKKKTIRVSYSEEERKEAMIKSEQHENDALHIIIAEREKADFIVTRNTEHFIEIGTTIPIRIPEKLI